MVVEFRLGRGGGQGKNEISGPVDKVYFVFLFSILSTWPHDRRRVLAGRRFLPCRGHETKTPADGI